jgi:hypothetical protein
VSELGLDVVAGEVEQLRGDRRGRHTGVDEQLFDPLQRAAFEIGQLTGQVAPGGCILVSCGHG